MQAFAERASQRGGMGNNMPTPMQTSQQTPPNQSSGAIQQLKQSQPDEAIIIVKALIQRLRELTRAEFGDKPTSQPSPQGGLTNATV